MYGFMQINLLVLQKGNARPREMKVLPKPRWWRRAEEELSSSSFDVLPPIRSPSLQGPEANYRIGICLYYFEMLSQAQQEFLVIT